MIKGVTVGILGWCMVLEFLSRCTRLLDRALLYLSELERKRLITTIYVLVFSRGIPIRTTHKSRKGVNKIRIHFCLAKTNTIKFLPRQAFPDRV